MEDPPGSTKSKLDRLLLGALLIRYLAGRGGAGGMGVYFWIFSAIAILGAIRVITHPQPVYSALYFVLTVLASAGLFVLLWAEFMAAALVLIYAGAILITYVFVIMLAAEASPQRRPASSLVEYDTVSREPVAAAAVGFALMAVLLIVIFDRAQGLEAVPQPPQHLRVMQTAEQLGAAENPPARAGTGVEGAGAVAATEAGPSVQQLGTYLFQHELVNLELAGVILTLSMVGAIVIARRRVVSKEEWEAPATEVVSEPLAPATDDPYSIPVYGTDNPRQKEYPER
jgi:NADH-quinone oxidoreductase subunit J